jgi:hypothetical protein
MEALLYVLKIITASCFEYIFEPAAERTVIFANRDSSQVSTYVDSTFMVR